MPKRSQTPQRLKDGAATEKVSVAHWPPTQEEIEALPREFAKDHSIPLDVVLQLPLPVNHDTLTLAASNFNEARGLPDYTPRFGANYDNAWIRAVRQGIKRRFKAAKLSGAKEEARLCWQEWKHLRRQFYSNKHMPPGWEGAPWYKLIEKLDDVIEYVEKCLASIRRFGVRDGRHPAFDNILLRGAQEDIRNVYRSLDSLRFKHDTWPDDPVDLASAERMLSNLLLALGESMSGEVSTAATHNWQPPEEQPLVEGPMPTNHSDRVAAFTEEGCEDGIDPIEELLNHQPLAIYRILKGRRHSTQYDTLREYGHLWRRDSPSDETIQRALLRLQSELETVLPTHLTSALSMMQDGYVWTNK